jgi:hypothetical protein
LNSFILDISLKDLEVLWISKKVSIDLESKRRNEGSLPGKDVRDVETKDEVVGCLNNCLSS